MNIYVIDDLLTNGQAGVPFFSQTDYSAMREVSNVFATNPNSQPRQFSLYCIGELDNNHRIISTGNRLVCNLGDCKSLVDARMKELGVDNG